MAAQEIKDTHWEKFCERFEEAHRGELISLEVVNHEGEKTALAKNQALQSMRFDKSGGCSNLIHLKLDGGAGTTVQHEIVEPIHVRLREQAGSQKILEIDAESGSVEIHFSSGQLAAILKDLETSPPRVGNQGATR